MSERELYDLLEVSPRASDSEIKKVCTSKLASTAWEDILTILAKLVWSGLPGPTFS